MSPYNVENRSFPCRPASSPKESSGGLNPRGHQCDRGSPRGTEIPFFSENPRKSAMCATTSPRDFGIAGIRDFLKNARHCKIFAGSSENALVNATGDTETSVSRWEKVSRIASDRAGH